MPNYRQTGILKIQWFSLSILIFGQKSCFLDPPSLKFHNRTDIIKDLFRNAQNARRWYTWRTWCEMKEGFFQNLLFYLSVFMVSVSCQGPFLRAICFLIVKVYIKFQKLVNYPLDSRNTKKLKNRKHPYFFKTKPK